jgi:hypothetical protein
MVQHTLKKIQPRRVALLGGLLIAAALAMALAVQSPLVVDARQGGLPGADTSDILDYVLNQDPYTEWDTWTADRWTDFSSYIESRAPHTTTARIFVNDIARAAADAEDFDGILPPGSIIVKESYDGMPDAPGDLVFIALMYKIEGFNPAANDWYWIEVEASDTQIMFEGADSLCISCHNQPGNVDYLLRYAFGAEPLAQFGTPLPPADADAIIDYVRNQDPYAAWGTWPTDEVNTEDYASFLPGESVHGRAVRIYVNDRALNALASEHFHGILPPGSLIVKEDYSGQPESPGDPVALTLMYKVDGFSAEGNDWYWVGEVADGTVSESGASTVCLDCHSQEGNSDYLLRYDLSPYVRPMMDAMGVGIDADAVIDAACTVCHTRERIDSAEKDEAGWTSTVDRMIGYGAALTDVERDAVIAYLAADGM